MELVSNLKVFSDFANYQTDKGNVYLKKAIGGKAVAKICDLNGNERKIERSTGDKVWFTGRDDGLKDINNNARRAFLDAVLTQYGGQWANVPKSVRDQLELGDYLKAGKTTMKRNLEAVDMSVGTLQIDSGKPLTARRILAVIKAINDEAIKEAKELGPAGVAAKVLDLMPNPGDNVEIAKPNVSRMKQWFCAFFDSITKDWDSFIGDREKNRFRNQFVQIPGLLIKGGGNVPSKKEMFKRLFDKNQDSLMNCADRVAECIVGKGSLAVKGAIIEQLKEQMKGFVDEIKKYSNPS